MQAPHSLTRITSSVSAGRMAAATSFPPPASDDEGDDFTDEDCQKLIDEFVAITDTNSAIAHMFLKDRKWKLLAAVDDYFEQVAPSPVHAAKVRPKHDPDQVVDLTSDSEHDADDEDSSPFTKRAKTKNAAAAAAAPASPSSSTATVTSGPSSGPVSGPPVTRNELIFVTWNTDGINGKNLIVRAEGMIKIVKQIQPDILFLQEVVPESEGIIRQQLSEYSIFSGQVWKGFPANYYTLTLIRKETVNLVSSRVIDYDQSVMTRNVIVTKVRCNEITLNLLNTHLESTKDYASHRIKQLMTLKDLVKEMPADEAVIVAGDLNMRDKELDETGGLPQGWIDVWEATGKRPESRYTWDTLRNDNCDGNFGKFKPRCRFDRVLVRDTRPSKFIPKTFTLIGIERLKPNVCFPSDHWGILTVFRTFAESDNSL